MQSSNAVLRTRIYPEEYSVISLMRTSAGEVEGIKKIWSLRLKESIHVSKLEASLKNMDVELIRRRRALWEQLLEEALNASKSSSDSDGGLSFMGMLSMLARYKLSDNEGTA